MASPNAILALLGLQLCVCVCVSCSVVSDSVTPTDCSPPGSSVRGILQARILEWVAISSCRGSSQPRDWTWISHIAGRFYTILATTSVLFSHSVMSDSLWPHGLQHAKLPCPSPTPRAYSNSCPLSRWCHPTISSSIVPFSSHLQSFPASGSFPRSQFFTSCGQSIGASASAVVLPMNIQGWYLAPRGEIL